MSQGNIINVDVLSAQQLILHDPYEVSDSIVRMDISRDKLKPVMIYVDECDVISFNKGKIIVSVTEDLGKKLLEVDKYFLSEIVQRKIQKRIKAKSKFSYNQMAKSCGDDKENESKREIMELNVSNDTEYGTRFYITKQREIQEGEAMNLMKNNARVKFVFELTSVVFDKERSVIYVENVVRQIKIKKLQPKRIRNLSYSFIDTDDDGTNVVETNENEIKETNDQDIIDVYDINEERSNSEYTDLNDMDDNDDTSHSSNSY